MAQPLPQPLTCPPKNQENNIKEGGVSFQNKMDNFLPWVTGKSESSSKYQKWEEKNHNRYFQNTKPYKKLLWSTLWYYVGKPRMKKILVGYPPKTASDKSRKLEKANQ